MKRKKYYYLDPVIIRIPGIKTLFEKSVGKRDARQNQVCSNGEVHTTPFIDAKVNSYNAHITSLWQLSRSDASDRSHRHHIKEENCLKDAERKRRDRKLL